MKSSLTLLTALLLVPLACWAELPENLAPRAKVSASSEYSGDYAAKFAVDGKVPAAGSRADVRQAWCCNGAKAGGQAEFALAWDQPVDVAEIVYWGRTAQLLSECWKDYEVYFDQDAQPSAKGTFRMVAEPQRIAVAKRRSQKVRLKFLSGYEGGQNHGASEIAVYASRPSDEQLDLFPLTGRELEERIRLAEEEKIPLRRAAATIPGKVVFLSGTRPSNMVDWTAPSMQPPTTTTPAHSIGYGRPGQTYRCYTEKDTPGPSALGKQLYLLNPAEPQSVPRLLVDASNGWIGGAMSVSYDGSNIYFAMAPEGEPFFHIYRIAVAGGKPEQLTRGTFQDVDPDILPDGRIVFSSTRFGGREEYHGYLVSTLFTMGPRGEDIQPLTYHIVNDREPKVTAAGSIVFVRQDNFFMNAKIETQIHQIHADGTGGTVLLGQDREGSGYDRVTAHERFPKAIGFLTPNAINFKRTGNAFGCPTPLPDGRVAALCSPTGSWSGYYPFKKHAIGIVISATGTTTDGQPVETSQPLYDISAMPDGRLLGATLDQKSLGIVDLKTGEVRPFYTAPRGPIHAPLYVGPRPSPRVMPAATPANDNGRATGFFYCQNVFNTKQRSADLKRIKAVRVLEAQSLTVRMLAAPSYHGAVNHIGTEAVELGVVPLAADGSFFIEVPADRALAFQAIDAEGRAVINELSWIYVRPGERRSCLGCHASRYQAPQRYPDKLMGQQPLRLTGAGRPFRYKANTLAHGGVTGTNLDRVRETKSINLYPERRATTVRMLCEQLRTGIVAEKLSAAQHLAVLRDKTAVPALLGALGDNDCAVRLNAALALASCGTRAAVDGLMKATRDPDRQVVLAARLALTHLTGHDEQMPVDWPTIERQQIALLNDADPARAIMAAQTLGHIGAEPAQQALREFAGRCLDLKDTTDLRSLQDALRALGQLRDVGAVPLLKSVLETHLPLPKAERSAKLAEAAAEALGWIGTDEAAQALIDAAPRLKRFWEYNLALGDQGGGWGDYLSVSPVHYRYLEAFDAMGTKLPESVVFILINSLHMSFDQPLLLEPDMYETLLARVVQRSGCLNTILDSGFAMIGVESGPINEAFRSSLVEQVYTHKYPQMDGKRGEAFTVPQRVAYILAVLGIRPEDAPRYQRAFQKYRDRFQVIRSKYHDLETGACAWICFYSLETLGRLRATDAYDTFLRALTQDPPEVVDGIPDVSLPKAHWSTTPHYRVAAAYGLGQLGNHNAVPALLAAVKNFDNALEVRHTAARALVKLCDASDRELLRITAETYPEVVIRRELLTACQQEAQTQTTPPRSQP